MAQSIGYLLAAIGPTLFGFMHDMTHNWNVSLIILIVTAILLGDLDSLLVKINI